jgi:Xaa-Pro aminopeptidase
MEGAGIDLLAVGPGDHMTYLLGFHPHPDERPCLLLLTPERTGFLMPALNAEESRQHTDLPMETWGDGDGPSAALGRLAGQLDFAAVRRVALDEAMRTDFSLLLLDHLDGATPVLTTDLLGRMRMRKEPAEIERIQLNAELADRAMRAAYAAVRPGASELQVAQAVAEAFDAAGADRVNFAIVGGGPNGAFPHHHTGPRTLNVGDAVVIDIGASKDSYNSDITRMASVGDPGDDYRKVHAIVEAAVQAALAVIRPGVRARDVDDAARSIITEAGYGEYFVHRTGHGFGLTGHEPPYITATNDLILEEGMTFSVEPGVYLPGRFGIRLEEIVAVTDRGARVFSKLSRDLHTAEA